MLLETLQKAKIFQVLYLIDEEIAERQRLEACPFCGSPLHYSNYLRKPRGGPDNLPEELLIRHSFCCAKEECRKRVLPVSCRFWNRKVYWGAVILVIMTLQQNRTEGYSAGKLMKLFAISRQTLKRWLDYFRQIFPSSSIWQRIKGHIGIEISPNDLPKVVVLFFIKQAESEQRGLINSLRFLLGGFKMV